MKIAHLTAGTGNFHCGNCHRDNALVRALRAEGHDAYLVPLYLPLVLDEPAATPEAPLFAGGINMFLQQKVPLFRHTPRWIDRAFDATGLLRFVSRFAGMTRARDLGEMTVETLRGTHSHQAKEWERLVEWLAPLQPDVVALSNGLLAGLAEGIKKSLGCRVVCSLQGEDSFLDSLPEPHRTEAWRGLAATATHVDRFVGVSRYYAALMEGRMGLAPGTVEVVRNGVSLEGLPPASAPPEVPTIGYFARQCHGKGLHLLVEAFIMLKQRGNLPGLRLRVGGAKTAIDEEYVTSQEARLVAAGVRGDVEFHPNVPAEEKASFLQSLSVLSVPAIYGESFGLFVIEALACGVPVVEPEHAAFPELVHATGGGVLCAPDDPASLAAALEQLLLTPGLTRQLGERGRAAVEKDFTAARMAREFAAVCHAGSG
ncbi:MAG: glycosyltransferase family 4 protein [Verrucomicrobiales bacterium]